MLQTFSLAAVDTGLNLPNAPDASLTACLAGVQNKQIITGLVVQAGQVTDAGPASALDTRCSQG